MSRTTRLFLAALMLPALVSTAFAAPQGYQGQLDVVEMSGEACRGGDRNPRPLELFWEVRKTGTGLAVEGFLYGEAMEPGRISGSDLANLTVVYPGDGGAVTGQGHRLSLRLDGDVLSGELWEAHLEETAPGCNFDHAFVSAFKIDPALAPKKMDQARELYRARELERGALHRAADGNLERCEADLLEALEIRKRVFGAEHAEVAVGLSALGIFYCTTLECRTAEAYLIQALELREKFLGRYSSPYLESLLQLGSCYFEDRAYQKAERMFKQALELRERTLGPNHAEVSEVLLRLAPALAAQGQFFEAEEVLKRALEIVEFSFGPLHPEMIEVVNFLAQFYERAGKQDQALQFYRRAQDIRELIDPEGTRTADALAGLGAKYAAARRFDEALACGRRVLEMRERLYGSEHLAVTTTLEYLAGLYTVAGRPSEAEALLLRSVHVKETLLGPSSQEYVRSVYALAKHYFNNGQKSEGGELLLRLLKGGNLAVSPATDQKSHDETSR